MKYLKIIFLHFEHVFENRLRSFIWFLIPLMNNLLLIVFWKGSVIEGKNFQWTMSSITSYYFIMTIVGSMLSSHIEEDVSEYDIQEGDLVRYLTRPFSYYLAKFIEELPYRLLQGSYGIILFVLFIVFFHPVIALNTNLTQLPFLLIILAFGFAISFTLKMILGLTTFWFKENGGLFELYTILNIVLSGGIVPLDLAPPILRNISYFLPFSYTGYFPIIAIQGKLDTIEILKVISIQSFWFAGLLILSRLIWNRGIKIFTAVGQ